MEVVDEIVNSAVDIPRVETLIFPQLKSHNLHLHSVPQHDELVLATREEINRIFSLNWLGIESYLSVYSQYKSLLNGVASNEVEEFLQSEQVVLKSFKEHFDGYNRLIDQLYVLWVDVRLGIFSLSCTELNQLLISNGRTLLNQLSLFLAQHNRKINKSICERYEEIAKKLGEDPDDTQAMTELRKFVEEAQSITITGLLEEVKESLERLSFIIELVDLTDEDVKMNSSAFLWPKRIDPLFDEARLKLLTNQEKAVAKVNEMKENLEKVLNGLDEDIQEFKEKEVGRDMSEMYADKKLLDDITKRILECHKESQNVNNEEELLEFNATPFPLCQTLITEKAPFDTLWNTAINFFEQQDKWLNGPFSDLDAQTIQNELDDKTKLMLKLSRQLTNYPNPKKSASLIKQKLEKFKDYLPIINVVCYHGLRDRHWEKMSEVVGFPLKPKPGTPLNKILELDLGKYIEQLEEITQVHTVWNNEMFVVTLHVVL
eukprot:TRINITY_DN943_c0_g2_i3.p1 TRINITY_DN943_c0_g2~~TRINITY_DN943_c0_g2_i3.p1  ORF type:complete len:488 (-),score=135.61 TRINITY_DN943_c0_g2_i3:651-2114(-)